MQPDDRCYVWAPASALDALRALGGVVGAPADDGRFLVKLRADNESALGTLPAGVTVLARPVEERASGSLASVLAAVDAATVAVRAAQGDA